VHQKSDNVTKKKEQDSDVVTAKDRKWHMAYRIASFPMTLTFKVMY